MTVRDDGATEELSGELSVDEALAVAISLHRSGDFDTAETLYNRILEAAVDHPDALHFLGLLNHERGEDDKAIELIRRAIAVNPGLPDSHNSLGNLLAARGRDAQAAVAYRAALELDPNHASAHANLGLVLRMQGKLDEAESAYRRAIEIDPKHLGAFQNLGNLLRSRGRVEEAVICLCQAMTLAPQDPKTRKMLAMAYTVIGKMDEAAQIYRDWLADSPENPTARHLHAACTGEAVPERADDAYVRETFNSFAETFDSKLERLDYRAPGLIAHALREALARPGARSGAKLRCLDAGCGTGLCGPLIAPCVDRLIGVDLSANMLARATKHNVYHELVEAELTTYLESHPDAFDVIVSADTLVYFGALERVIRAAALALVPSGHLIFTLEDACEDCPPVGYRLQPHGRYAHGKDYVTKVLAEARLELVTIRSDILRSEAGRPVAGLVVTALSDQPQERDNAV